MVIVHSGCDAVSEAFREALVQRFSEDKRSLHVVIDVPAPIDLN